MGHVGSKLPEKNIAGMSKKMYQDLSGNRGHRVCMPTSEMLRHIAVGRVDGDEARILDGPVVHIRKQIALLGWKFAKDQMTRQI
jgi:hypothetical protein